MGAMLRVGQIAPAGKLVTLLAMLASALTIGLAGNRGISAAFAANAAGGEHDVDRAEHVLDAVALMFDAARVQKKTAPGGAPPFSRLTNRLLGDARYFGRLLGSPRSHMFGDGLEADGVPLDEFVIEPIVLDHQVQNAVEECRVATGLHRQK